MHTSLFVTKSLILQSGNLCMTIILHPVKKRAFARQICCAVSTIQMK